MDQQREMTLDEWVDRLPESHVARRELTDLRSQLAAEREAKEALAKTCVTLWTSGDFIRKADAWSEMMSNPIARAEVEKASKV